MILNRRDEGISEGAVYVGRPSKWGNPFTFPSAFCPTREDAVEAYRLHVTVGEGRYLPFEELMGRDLVCWCAPRACHAEVLVELAEKLRVDGGILEVEEESDVC